MKLERGGRVMPVSGKVTLGEHGPERVVLFKRRRWPAWFRRWWLMRSIGWVRDDWGWRPKD